MSRAFTLLELAVVIVILGVIVSIAIPRVTSANENALLNAAVTDFRQLELALRMYHADHGAFPPNSQLGVFPPELKGYYSERAFLAGPTLGGRWDWNPTFGPVTPNITMEQNPPDVDLWLRFDERYDDGNLRGGKVWRHNTRYLMWQIVP